MLENYSSNQMKTKILSAQTEKSMETKANEWLAKNSYPILSINYHNSLGKHIVFITYLG
jgi:hypothetical protein